MCVWRGGRGGGDAQISNPWLEISRINMLFSESHCILPKTEHPENLFLPLAANL